MDIHTIPKKMSNTGSIHDLASDHFDRDIKFASGAKYAVVLAAHYGGKGYTTHRTVAGTVKAARALSESGYSYEIIDIIGHRYWSHAGRLVKQ